MAMPRSKLTTILWPAAALILWHCAAGSVYTLAQLHGNDNLQHTLRGKRVEVSYQDGHMATGYFWEATVDSIMLQRKKNDALFSVPTHQARMIRTLDNQKTEIVVAVIVVGTTVLLILMGQSLSEGYSSQR